MCGRSSVRLSRSKQRADMLSRSMYPASLSALMHQVLRLRFMPRKKLFGRIFYSSAQSTLAYLSLELWRIIESSSDTRVCVSNHSVANRVARTLATDYSVIQSTWRRSLSITSSWDDSAIEGRMFPLNTLYQSLALDPNLLADADVRSMKRKALILTVREA